MDVHSKLPLRPVEQSFLSRQDHDGSIGTVTAPLRIFETLKTYGKTVNQKTQKNTFLINTRLIRVSYLITGDVVSKTQERFQEKNKFLCTSAHRKHISHSQKLCVK